MSNESELATATSTPSNEHKKEVVSRRASLKNPYTVSRLRGRRCFLLGRWALADTAQRAAMRAAAEGTSRRRPLIISTIRMAPSAAEFASTSGRAVVRSSRGRSARTAGAVTSVAHARQADRLAAAAISLAGVRFDGHA